MNPTSYARWDADTAILALTLVGLVAVLSVVGYAVDRLYGSGVYRGIVSALGVLAAIACSFSLAFEFAEYGWDSSRGLLLILAGAALIPVVYNFVWLARKVAVLHSIRIRSGR